VLGGIFRLCGWIIGLGYLVVFSTVRFLLNLCDSRWIGGFFRLGGCSRQECGRLSICVGQLAARRVDYILENLNPEVRVAADQALQHILRDGQARHIRVGHDLRYPRKQREDLHHTYCIDGLHPCNFQSLRRLDGDLSEQDHKHLTPR